MPGQALGIFCGLTKTCDRVNSKLQVKLEGRGARGFRLLEELEVVVKLI